jgi:hypothetical protein
MPNLHQTLRSTDLDFLQRIASIWRIELDSKSFPIALEEIEQKLTDKDLFTEILEALPANAKVGWEFLIERAGKETWSIFTRQFGELRAFGRAKREREAPDQKPISAVEALWYRGLIGRAFLSSGSEPQEFAYIPDEFLSFLHSSPVQGLQMLPRPAAAIETKFPIKGSDRILDDATEMLAALRMKRTLQQANLPRHPAYLNFLTALLKASSFITPDQTPDPARLKDFLESNRSNALLSLYKTWMNSTSINDLHMLPGLLFEGNWENDPLVPRKLISSILTQLDPTIWWSTSSLLNQIKENQPDFQRPAGDYDSWFIRDAKTNIHLQGAKNWDKIDGSLLRYLIAGPLHWLGVVDLACSEKNSRPMAFKLSALGVELLKGKPPSACSVEDGFILLTAENTIQVSLNAPRAVRYQIARFGSPLKQTAIDVSYRISPSSLRQAADQGLSVNHLLQLFQQAKIKNIPPNLVQQLERWEKYGVEAAVSQAILLRLSRPEILPLLQKNPRASRCLAEVLNPRTIVVKPGSVESLRKVLAEMGFLADIVLEGEV